VGPVEGLAGPADWWQDARRKCGPWSSYSTGRIWNEFADGGWFGSTCCSKIAELLGAGGITSFAQLASTPTEQIQSILNAGGLSSHDPTTWAAQSQMAADGKWDELKVWQDELDGGKQVTKDDLTKVEGIGPKLAEILNASGINGFKTLAGTTPVQLRAVLDMAEGNFAAHDPSTWPQQAQMAADGKWDELQKWQDELDGGRA